MKIVAGLGNPGVKYQNTPHNVGFDAVDLLAARIGAGWEEKRSFKALVARGTLEGEDVLLLKPQTFMNLSGDAVATAVKYSNCSASDLVVVQDDIDLPLGRFRVRKGGSCGGHNGVRNIIERLGTQDFVRVKIGVGKDRDDVIGFVLGKFSPDARKIADMSASAAADAVCAVLRDGAEKAMNAFNGWRPVQ